MKSQLRFKSLVQVNAFGGELLKNKKNRHARPMSSRDPVHLVLKSTKAKGVWSFRHHRNLKPVRELIEKECAKFGVKRIKYANSGNHLHLFVKFGSREIYIRFIKSLTCKIAMLITGAKKLSSLKEKFFDYRPFTRIVKGLKPFKIVVNYICLNELEAEGVIPHRDGRLKDLRDYERRWFAFG